MGNSCNQIPTLSNTAEIVEIKKSFRTTPLRWSKFITTFILIPHSAGVSKITKT
jgi:hypothetical protein